jgi:hypothetical protein
MGWMLAHGGRITGDEITLITVLVIPLVIVIMQAFRKASRAAGAWTSSQDDNERIRVRR